NTYGSTAPNVATGAYDGLGIAIRLSNVRNSLDVTYNTVNVSNSQWPVKGIVVENYNRALGTSFIANNSINVGQPWSGNEFTGIIADRANFLELYNNSIVVNGNNSDNACVTFENSNRNTMINNILEVQVAGDAVFQSSIGSVTLSDHNDYYAPGNDIVEIDGAGGGNYATLAALQAATGMEANSFNVNPIFYDVKRNNLHVCNNLLSKSAMPIAGITEDIDGDSRSQTPSIGADEFTPINEVRLVDDYGLCPGNSTVITAGAGNFGETAIWKDLSTGLTIDTNYSINVSTPGDYKVTFFNACGVVVDTIKIITPATVALPKDTNLCEGASLLVDASITDGVSYMWGSMDTTSTYTVTKQAIYNVTATDKWGCVTDDQFNVTYSPSANIPQTDTIVCLGKFFNVNSSIDISIGATFKWSGFPLASTETDPIVSILADDVNNKDYIYVEVNHRGCITTDSIQITLITTPSINLKDTTNGLLFSVLTNNSGGNSHSWSFGDGNTSSFAKPKHIYGATGTYEVKYSNSNICGKADTTYEVTVLVLSLSENSENSSLMVYPNPNNGQFNLGFAGITAEDVSIAINDMNGRVVFSKDYGSINGNVNDEINLSDIAAGYYTIKVELDGEIYQEKFIVK
ncbi:T9SS type A sorting domain-containing protein, partial [Salibacteraceae bacterium]|nr:T9SS type A sorting domain-containing protein [Salibacteraceae bacterium]